MKTIRRTISVILVLAILCCIPMVALALTRRKMTTYYGRLTGTITQSGTALTTTTSVTENQYEGFLVSTILLTDGIETRINESQYWSHAGALELTNTTYMLGITSPTEIILPEYAAYCVEVRGGRETGDFFTIYFDVDSSVFG